MNFGLVKSAVFEWSIILFSGERVQDQHYLRMSNLFWKGLYMYKFMSVSKCQCFSLPEQRVLNVSYYV